MKAKGPIVRIELDPEEARAIRTELTLLKNILGLAMVIEGRGRRGNLTVLGQLEDLLYEEVV